MDKFSAATFQELFRVEAIVDQAVLCKESFDALRAPVPIREVNNLNHLVLFIEGIQFSCRLHSSRPHFIYTEVKMLAAVDPHEYDIVLCIFFTLRILLFAISKLILAGLLIEYAIEVVEQCLARRIEIDEDC